MWIGQIQSTAIKDQRDPEVLNNVDLHFTKITSSNLENGLEGILRLALRRQARELIQVF